MSNIPQSDQNRLRRLAESARHSYAARQNMAQFCALMRAAYGPGTPRRATRARTMADRRAELQEIEKTL